MFSFPNNSYISWWVKPKDVLPNPRNNRKAWWSGAFVLLGTLLLSPTAFATFVHSGCALTSPGTPDNSQGAGRRGCATVATSTGAAALTTLTASAAVNGLEQPPSCNRLILSTTPLPLNTDWATTPLGTESASGLNYTYFWNSTEDSVCGYSYTADLSNADSALRRVGAALAPPTLPVPPPAPVAASVSSSPLLLGTTLLLFLVTVGLRLRRQRSR